VCQLGVKTQQRAAVKRREQPLVRVEYERVGPFQRPWYLGRRERAKMPEPPYAPLTLVSENVLTDTIYSLGIMICFITA
jgi:hypothetical protein